MRKRIILFIISFAILVLLVYFSNAGETVEVIAGANLFLITAAFSIWGIETLVRTLRWQVLLRRIDIRIRFPEAWKIMVASMFVSNLSPAKTGDPIRSVILKRSKDKSFSSSLSSIVIERILDITFLIAVALVSMFFLFTQMRGMGQWLYLSILLYVAVIIAGIFIISSEKRSDFFFTRLFRMFSFIPKVKSYEKRVKEGSQKLHQAFNRYGHAPTLITSLLLTALIWTLQASATFVSFMALGMSVPFWACVAVVPLAILIGVLTFLPGAIGSAEVIKATFFTTLFSFTLSQATAATLISRFLIFWPYVFVGAVLFSLKFK
ncbi:MAG: flippase-like domain-containing protein [archaeon]|nr:MAG: flippase-like domain-containing protein [archaeon]